MCALRDSTAARSKGLWPRPLKKRPASKGGKFATLAEAGRTVPTVYINVQSTARSPFSVSKSLDEKIRKCRGYSEVRGMLTLSSSIVLRPSCSKGGGIRRHRTARCKRLSHRPIFFTTFRTSEPTDAAAASKTARFLFDVVGSVTKAFPSERCRDACRKVCRLIPIAGTPSATEAHGISRVSDIP